MSILIDPNHVLEAVTRAKSLVQQSKECIADSKKLQETYDGLRHSSDELLKEWRERRLVERP